MSYFYCRYLQHFHSIKKLSNCDLRILYSDDNLSYQYLAMKEDIHVSIKSKMNGMAMTLSDGQFNNKLGDIIATIFTKTLKQKWSFEKSNDPQSQQTFIIRNALNKNVLDIQGSTSQNYATAICFKVRKSQSQRWKIKKYKNYVDVFIIENIKSGLVLEVQGGIDAEGMRIVQNKYYGNLNQLWFVCAWSVCPIKK